MRIYIIICKQKNIFCLKFFITLQNCLNRFYEFLDVSICIILRDINIDRSLI